MKLTFSQLGKHGRLGNQLFQIASTLGMAEKYGAAVAFPAWRHEQAFETELPHGEMEVKRVAEEYFHHYDWQLQDSCDLFGYLQSEKYFGSTKLRLKPAFVDECKAKYAAIFEKETICIQIRRGDYVGNANYHQLTPIWYIDVLRTHFPHWRDCNILFTSDDIEYCRTHFECLPNATFSVGNSDIQDMALASACDHFIISNSTFGWWCAWLGEKPGSKIVHCGQLMAGKLLQNNDPRDYYPERWTLHQRENYKIPLMDVTFTIPVFMDHADRRHNLELSLCMLQKDFETNFIICEQGGRKLEYTSQWAQYICTDAQEFHRTKMLNDMCNLATTEFIVNWDCDVIIPPMQIWMAVEQLRAGADVVYPYDGRFARMPRAPWFGALQKLLDIGIVGAQPFKGREAGHNGVGGAVMFNRDSFMDGGMENEKMVSFGPEDCERHDRFKLLGYDVRMMRGSLFHLNHFVGVNSSPRNPYFAANHKELEKMRLMSKEEMRAYVDTWPWRSAYTSKYYHRISEGAIASARVVMDALYYRPISVIDVGCGVGEWNNGHPNYTGVDYRVARKDLLIAPERFIEFDLERLPNDLHSIDPRLTERYDLCLCLEVAEHLRLARAVALVEMLCNLSDRVLFSAAIPYQGGTGHVNEQWQSWWAGLFATQGFWAAKRQPDVRGKDGVELWYQQNMVLYERNAVGKVKDFVLPEYYEQIVGNLVRVKKDA